MGTLKVTIAATTAKRALCLLTVIAVCFMQSANAASKNGFPLDDALVPAKEIRGGGPAKNGIPALVDPDFVSADDASYLSGKDRVLGISRNGVVRAYPIRILNYHEIVNDLFGNEPVVVTYCPLCGTGMAFSSILRETRFIFGVSGLLYNSDVLMYDLETESLWSQLMSQAISGQMKGERLEQLSVSHTTWREWKSRHPETVVMSTNTGFRRNYRVDPYPNYSRSGKIFFPVNHSSKLYGRKSIVLGLEVDGKFKVYPFEELEKGPARIRDNFQGRTFEVRFDQENGTARIIDEDDRELPTTLAFWFAWYAFHPDSVVFTAESLTDQS